jgi:hypothetical protein
MGLGCQGSWLWVFTRSHGAVHLQVRSERATTPRQLSVGMSSSAATP